MPFILESAWVILAVLVVLRMRRAHRAQLRQDATDRQASAYFAAPETALRKGQLQPALVQLTQMLHQAPADFRARGYHLRATAWLQAQQPDQALRDCNDLLGLRPFSAPAWCLRAQIHLARHDYEAARDSIRYAQRLNPDDDTTRALALALDTWFAERARQPEPVTR